MEHIGKIVAFLILAINAFFVGTLILSAYSPYLSPKSKPACFQSRTCVPDISGCQLPVPYFLGIYQLPLRVIANHRFSGLYSANSDVYPFQFHHQNNP